MSPADFTTLRLASVRAISENRKPAALIQVWIDPP
jgi:hypothetical protein